MKKKTIIKTAIISLSVLFVCFAVLIVHIAVVIKHKTQVAEGNGRNLQLSRIDFTEKIDSVKANKITAFVAHLDGVSHTYFNVPCGILIYSYSMDKQTSASVYNQLMRAGNYKAHPFVVSVADMAKGCPAMGGKSKSFIYTLATYVSKLIG